MPADSASDDASPTKSLYFWSPGATLSIEEFVTKYKPSMIQKDETNPWLRVLREQPVKKSSVENNRLAIREAATILQQVTEQIQQIENRASKNTGGRSKKEILERARTEAAYKLKDISKKYGYVCGKWLIFVPPDKVDAVWSKLASSLASGPLSSTSAYCTKVATSPEDAAPGYQHVICIYIPDVYDKEDVTAVMKVLLRQHGVNLAGVKSDLYTWIGLDSKHPSGIPPTVWKGMSLMKNSEIKKLQDAYFTELAATKAISTPAADSSKPIT